MRTDSSTPTAQPSWRLRVEQFAPISAAALATLLVWLCREEICGQIASGQIDVDNLYAAVLSWASIQIGFAFGVFGFVLGKAQGFVEAARQTTAMRNFLKYVKRANVGGFTLTAVSLPLAVLSPAPGSPGSGEFWVVALWFGLFVWTFFAFLRIAFIFGQITSVPDKPPFFGA